MDFNFENCRLRFAPSPTGYLHIGGARTALFNWLLAKKYNGAFILRIEDTDRERYVADSVEQIINSLKWLGIDWAEGPDIGGAYGPYYQSQRLEIYKKYAEQLVADGHAYYCFCSADRLEQMREDQKRKGIPTHYDRRCRELKADKVKELLDSGATAVIRLKVPLVGACKFFDLIRDEVSIPYNNVDDQVLIKSDGFPTYHLANVVDDHLMKITAVIRGEEWLMSTPKHLLLYSYLGWQPPQYAHLPLLLNTDRSKLSKRQGDVAVSDYMKNGFLPEAVMNFIALLGWNPGDEREFFSAQELIQAFDISHCGKSGSVFDIKKLRWMNGMYIRALKKNAPEKLADLLKPILLNADVKSEFLTAEKMQLIIKMLGDSIETLNDILNFKSLLFDDNLDFSKPEFKEILTTEKFLKLKEILISEFKKIENLTEQNMLSIIKIIQQSVGIKGKELYSLLRLAISAELEGPDLGALLLFLNKECLLKRLTINQA